MPVTICPQEQPDYMLILTIFNNMLIIGNVIKTHVYTPQNSQCTEKVISFYHFFNTLNL